MKNKLGEKGFFMGTVKSNQEVAHTYASQLANACQTLSSSATVSKDTQTNLAGNTRCHEAIDKSATILAQITSAVKTASDNLHSVANDFEAVDQAGAKSFGG